MVRQEQEIKLRKQKQEVQKKEILSDRIERRKLIMSHNEKGSKRESLLDKFSEKYLDKSLNSSSSKLEDTKKIDDDYTFEYLNNLRQRLTGSTSVTELNRSTSNLAQIKTNTPIINNRKRMSLQRKSLLSQFDSFLGSPLNHSSSKQQIIQQPNVDNIANLANLAAATSNWDTSNKKSIECTESPTMLPRIAPQCQGQPNNSKLNKNQNNKQLTNSCSVFHFGSNSPFGINNSPALKQRSLYAERILSNSSLTLSNLSRFPNSKNSTLSSGTSFSNSLFKPFRESIHYATSLRKETNNLESKSHLKSATSEFSFIRLTNNNNSSTLTKTKTDDDTLKRNKNAFNRSNFNRMHSFANDCSDDCIDSEQDLSNSIISDYNNGTLRNELRNSKTITNLNSEQSKRTHILHPNDLLSNNIGRLNNLGTNLINNNQMNQVLISKHHNYQKMKKINNSLDESDSTFSSSNSSSSSSNNYNLINRPNELNNKRQSRLTQDILSYSPKLSNNSPNQFDYSLHTNLMTNSPLVNQKKAKNSTKSNYQNDKEHTYQKVNSKRSSNKQSSMNNKNQPSSNKTTNGNKSTAKKKSSLIPVSNVSYRLNESIYQSTTSTEKRKTRMNKILENQSKLFLN